MTIHSSQGNSWRSKASRPASQLLVRSVRRAAILLLLIMLAFFLVRSLFPPFFAPTTHLVMLGSGTQQTLDVPSIPFVAEDQQGLQAIEAFVSHRPIAILQSARNLDQLSDEIAQYSVKKTDTLFIYLTAQGISQNGQAYLLCENFDLRRPDAGRISVAALLEQIRKSVAGVKVLVINSGTLNYDPRLGLLVNEFPSLLKEAVKKSNDPSLWVYNSHSSLETSHISRVARRSVFGLFVAEGLAGAADFDRDHRIDIRELVSFTSANATRWVEHFSNGGASQSPELMWGGAGDPPATSPTLITTPRNAKAGQFDISEFIKANVHPESSGSEGSKRKLATGPTQLNASSSESAASLDKEEKTVGESDAAKGDAGADEIAEAGSKSKRATADPTLKATQLVSEAWQLRDRILVPSSNTNPKLSPVQNTPHRWREFERGLLVIEQRADGEAKSNPTVTISNLEANLLAPSPDSETVRALALLKHSHSLALAQSIAERQKIVFPIDVTGLNAALAQDSRQGLDEWLLKNWHSGFEDYYELRFLKRLTDDKDIDWSLLQLAIQTCLQGEHAAALDWQSPGWSRPIVEHADQLRFYSEQLIFDRIGLEWEQVVRRAFEQSAALYDSSIAVSSAVGEAELLRDTVFNDGPYYLHLFHATQGGTVAEGVKYEVLHDLLEKLSELSNLLDRPHTSKTSEVVRASEALAKLRSSLQLACGDNSAESLLVRAPLLGDSWRAELLLKTPMLSSDVRLRLLSAVESLESAAMESFQPAKITSVDSDERLLAAGPQLLSTQQRDCLLQQAQLETEFAALCELLEVEESEGRQASLKSDHYAAVRQSLEWLEKEHPVSINAYAKLGASLETFYASSTLMLGSTSSCQDTLWRTNIRLLRMLDSRDAWRMRNFDIASLSAAANLQSTMKWQATRFERAAAYHDVSSSTRLLEAASDYRHYAAEVCRQPDDASPSPTLSVVGQSKVDLQYSPVSNFSIAFDNPGSHDISTSIRLDYDRDQIQLSLVDDSDNTEISDTLSADNEPSDEYASIPNWIGLPRVVKAGQSTVLKLRCARRGAASKTGKIVIDAFETAVSTSLTEFASASQSAVGENCRLLARHKIEIVLPVGEVYVQHDLNAAVSEQGKLTLMPFPNRLSEFKFGVVNQSSIDKQISLSLYNLNKPLTSISPEDYSSLVLGQEPLAAFKLTVPKYSNPSFPASEKDNKASPKAEGSDEPKLAEKSESAQVSKLKHGLLAVMEDLNSGQRTYREIRFNVQRPRRYLRPRVSFNSQLNRIEVEVLAFDRALVPAGAPVRVSCRLADILPGGLQGKLQDAIHAPNFKALMFIALPSTPPQVVRLYIDVDDFPRAFVFDVPCGKYLANVPEVTGRMDMRLSTSLTHGLSPARDSIPVALEIDAPVGTFEDGNDYVELGIDIEATGTSDPSAVTRLNLDRDVSIGLLKALPDGTVQLKAIVSDFNLTLPSDKLENVNAQVKTGFAINGEISAGPKIPLLIDTAPPIVGAVKPIRYAGFVPAKSQLELSVLAWDTGSGVKKIEAVLGPTDASEFPAEGDFTQATLQSDRQWTLRMAMGEKEGPCALLVRGVDEVGNQSSAYKVPLDVVALNAVAARVKQQTVDLIGTVTFRDGAVSDTEIKLIAIPADPKQSTKNNDPAMTRTKPDGTFLIPGVSPGSYQLSAKAVINNRVRRISKDIIIAPGSTPTFQVDVALP